MVSTASVVALHFEGNKTVPLRRVLLSKGVTVVLGIAGGVLMMITQRIRPREEPAVDVAESDALTREQAAALVSWMTPAMMTGQYGHWVPSMTYYNSKLLFSAVFGETPGRYGYLS